MGSQLSGGFPSDRTVPYWYCRLRVQGLIILALLAGARSSTNSRDHHRRLRAALLLVAHSTVCLQENEMRTQLRSICRKVKKEEGGVYIRLYMYNIPVTCSSVN